MSPRAPLLFLLALAWAAVCGAAEVQSHGLAFEKWVRDAFFEGYQPEDYTQKWDVPGSANHLADPTLAGLPVNPKATRFRAPVGLGDALRQYDVAEPFILVLGYWEQPTPETKRFVKILAPRIEPEAWRTLWGPVTRADLERLEAVIKDRSLSPAEARLRARELKDRPPFSEAVFTLNPKIDARGQRRLQCSLRYEEVLRRLAPGTDPAPEAAPTLWGRPFPGDLVSPPRHFDAPTSPPAAPAESE